MIFNVNTITLSNIYITINKTITILSHTLSRHFTILAISQFKFPTCSKYKVTLPNLSKQYSVYIVKETIVIGRPP